MAQRLGGVHEIAQELGISLDNRSTITNWAIRRETNGFPEPVASPKMGQVYDLDEVAAWFAKQYPDGLPRRAARTTS